MAATSKKISRSLLLGADGVVLVKKMFGCLTSTTPSALLRRLRDIFLQRSHPSSAEEGNTLALYRWATRPVRTGGRYTTSARRRSVAFGYGFAALCLAACGFQLNAGSGQTLKIDVDLVNIFATVKDDQGRFVMDLTKDDFRVYEDGQIQEIQIFEKQDKVDSSIGILMDTSGSMVDILPFMRRGIRDFTRVLPKSDEFFVITFGTAVNLLHSSSQSQKHLEDSLDSLRAWGTSSMYDGLLSAMARLERSDRPRKALIIFTDGNDNGSNMTHGQVEQAVQRSGVLLYFVAIGSPILVDSHTLEALSDLSGGRTLYVAKQDAVGPVLDQIRSDLAQQYYLGYYAPRSRGLHQLRVEVPGRQLRIRSKTAYRVN